MNEKLQHKTLEGDVISLKDLDSAEKDLLRELRSFLKKNRDWNTFTNFWVRKVGDFYEKRGLTRRETIQTPLFQVAQDMNSRLAVDLGLARAPDPNPDFRDQLIRLIIDLYSTRRAFCRETGISEGMLSHFLARRKNLRVETLSIALERIGYRLQIVPIRNGKN